MDTPARTKVRCLVVSRFARTCAVVVVAIGSALVLDHDLLRRAEADDPAAAEREEVEFFESRVRPILKQHCYKCHGALPKVKGGLRLTSRASILKGGETGPAVDLEQPGDSLLLEAIRYESLEMPPSGKLDPPTIDVLTKWVMLGIPWSPGVQEPAARSVATPAKPGIPAEARSFWSFQPAKRPDVPVTADRNWVRNPVDAFVLSKLEQAGLKPAPPANPIALVRRVYYDVTGLPPTPEQVDAFLADRAPDAYERLVDWLLASPHYGERWGRHWLDIVRFAETNSFERDELKPNAWRYRNYVIDALNEDKPYDEFAREQLAGDELDRVTPETLIATGYYRLGPWDDEPTDVLQAQYNELDDIVSTTGQVFLGLTVNCARCHNHKLDPILQSDYYSMLAFFHGVLPTETVKMAQKGVPGNTQIIIADAARRERYERELAAWNGQKLDLARRIAELDSATAAAPRASDAVAQNVPQTAGARGDKPLDTPAASVPFEAEPERADRLRRQLRQLNKTPPEPLPQALGVKEGGPVPPQTHVLVRGNAHVEGELVKPAFLSVLNWPAPDSITPPAGEASSGRRRAFADWVTDERNPLTSRVIVNRIWQHHFERGIVRSPNNFGTHGEPPTHPQLLDWLASELVHQGWRLKPLHRLILTSNTYRMSSRFDPRANDRDPANNLFWRMDVHRLEAEEVRDAILAVSGSLNPRMEGPSIYPEIPREVLQGQSRPGSGWKVSSPGEQARRSVYVHVKRSLLLPVLASFDFADTDVSCPVRFTTTQPTQALGMLNSAFLNEQAGLFASRLQSEAPADQHAQVERALRLALARPPMPDEIERGVQLIETFETRHGIAGEQALAQFCLMVLNLNEFLYLD